MKQVKLISILLTLVILFGCGNGNNKDRIEASGNIEATNVVVSSKVSGQVLKLLFDEGKKVNAGDTLMIIDHETLEYKLDQAMAGLKSVQAQLSLLRKGAREEDIKQVEEALNEAKINFNLAEKDLKRMTDLYNSKSITRKQFDDATAHYNIAQAQLTSTEENYKKIKNFARPEELKQAEANVDKQKATVDLIQKQIRDCYVTTPSSGFVVKKFVEAGETVSPMSSSFKISDLSSVKLVIYVSEEELGKVKLNQDAAVSVDAYPDKTFSGKVIYISPEAEFTPKNIQTKEERTKLVFEVKVQVDNPEFELKAGMPADASIITKVQD